jgi:hypothetical protein
MGVERHKKRAVAGLRGATSPLRVQIVQHCPSAPGRTHRSNTPGKCQTEEKTPNPREPLTDEEDRVEGNTGNDDSPLEGADKIRFRRLIA